MDLVIYKVVQFQIMHVSDGYRTVKELSGTSVAQTHFSVSGERHALPELSVLSVVREILEHLREQLLAMLLLKFFPFQIHIIICQVKGIHDIYLVGAVKYRCGNIESKRFRRKA